jgi:hypothetical protein
MPCGSVATATDDLPILADLSGTGATSAAFVDDLIERGRKIGKTDPRAALRLFERARLLAEEVGNEPGRARATLEAAGALQGAGLYNEAMARLSQALPIFEALGDVFGVASCRNTAGIIEKDRSNFETAIHKLTAAVDGFRLAG